MTPVTNPYAKALFKAGAIDDTFFAQAKILLETPPLWETLCNPCIPKNRKQTLLHAILDKDIRPEQRRFFDLLAENGRMESLSEILSQCRRLQLEQENCSDGVLRCVYPPDSETLKRVEQALCKMLGRSGVHLTVQQEESLIGGFIAEVDGFIWDQSVEGNLEHLRKYLQRTLKMKSR